MITHADAAELVDAGHRQGGHLSRYLDPSTTLDLSTCAMTRGEHPAIRPAYASIPTRVLRAHPFDAAERFLAAYTAFLGLDADNGLWLAGNGITDFLGALKALCSDVVYVGPDYTQTIGIFAPASPDPAECDDAARRAQRINHAMSRHAVVVCSNPNNPTGVHLVPEVLEHIAERNPDSLLVVDEAYVEFLDGMPTMIGTRPRNLLVLRASNKVTGAPGIRTGAAWTRDGELAAEIGKWVHRWPFSGPDSYAMTEALRQPDWIHESLDHVGMTSTYLHDLLVEVFGEPAVVESPLHFSFVKLPYERLMRVHHELEHRHGVAVRVFPQSGPGRVMGMRVAAPGLNDYLRCQEAFRQLI